MASRNFLFSASLVDNFLYGGKSTVETTSFNAFRFNNLFFNLAFYVFKYPKGSIQSILHIPCKFETRFISQYKLRARNYYTGWNLRVLLVENSSFLITVLNKINFVNIKKMTLSQSIMYAWECEDVVVVFFSFQGCCFSAQLCYAF